MDRTPSADTRRTTARRRLSPGLSMALLASVTVSFLAASAAPTPLYAHYQAEWHYNAMTTTVVFGVYAITVLVSLLTLGRLSDHTGRRPVLLAGLAGQAAAMVIFSTASGVPELMAGRVVQGVATGAALGAIGAGLLDIDRTRGTLLNSFSPGLGTGLGALVSALLVQFLPAPTHLVYLVLIGVFAVQAAGVLLMRETLTPAPGALASLVPDIRLPREVRRHVLTAAPVLFAVWALAGLYGALGPALVRQLSGSSNAVYGGLSLFVLAVLGSGSVLLLREAPARRVMLVGIGGLVVGAALVLAAVQTGSTMLFFVATTIGGVGFGSGFQGGVRTVVPRTAPHQRAGVLSLLYVISYLGMGAPAVVAGYLVVHAGGLLDTTREYSVALIVLGLLALAGLLSGDGRRDGTATGGSVLVASGGTDTAGAESAARTAEKAEAAVAAE